MDLAVPEGFLWSGVASGIKKHGKRDLGLAYSSYPATTAGVFTENEFAAAPVQQARDHLSTRVHSRGLVVNSGVANAATGDRGLETNRSMIESAADRLGLDSEEVLSASTGVIGKDLPVDKIQSGLPEATDRLGENPRPFAEAILTTDTMNKLSSRGVGESSLLGIAKGSGMIRPQMATMLAFLFFDHPVEAGFLHETLRDAVDESFNRITVDGEMSTNDTVLCMAANHPDREPIQPGHDLKDDFVQAIHEVTEELARSIVRDGEGATCLCEIQINGAPTETVAEDVASAVANSNLVKTALHARSPYCGRVFSAIGATGHAELNPGRLRIRFQGHDVFKEGRPVEATEEVQADLASADKLHIEVDLGQGGASAERWTCDFSEEYVTINSKV